MSGSGSIQGMITSLKNNKRSRASAFEKLKTYGNVKYKEGIIDKRATPHQLKEIRERIQKENKRNKIRTVVIVIGVVIGLYYLLKVLVF